MKKVLKKRTGFTLVELLIVIIIIGILAGAMLLVAGSATDKAEATKIVSNLRSLKTAALMYYADNPNVTVASIDDGGNDGIDLLKKYMDREISAPGAATYQFKATAVAGASDVWAVGLVEGDSGYPSGGVKEKLADVAKDTGLYPDETVSGDLFTKDDNNVFMKVR
jgi:general secretion pathway protein G